MADNVANMNQDIAQWAVGTVNELKNQFTILDIKHVKRSPSTTPSKDAIQNKFGRRQGQISKISFKFPRHMVFVHKGVGRGVPISLAGSSGTTRKPKEWFDPVIDKNVDVLADKVAEHAADIAIADLRIGK